MDSKQEYKLIITIVNRGFAEEVMDAAREAGAKGGTILHGRGTTNQTHTILGMKIEPEKELLLIVAERSGTGRIMEHIFEHAGLGTPGSGICFALPIEDVVGLHFDPKDGDIILNGKKDR